MRRPKLTPPEVTKLATIREEVAARLRQLERAKLPSWLKKAK